MVGFWPSSGARHSPCFASYWICRRWLMSRLDPNIWLFILSPYKTQSQFLPKQHSQHYQIIRNPMIFPLKLPPSLSHRHHYHCCHCWRKPQSKHQINHRHLCAFVPIKHTHWTQSHFLPNNTPTSHNFYQITHQFLPNSTPTITRAAIIEGCEGGGFVWPNGVRPMVSTSTESNQ